MAGTALVPNLDELRGGGKKVLATALAMAESHPDDPGVIALLDAAYREPRGHVVGVTGPPGVGKSTLINALIGRWRVAGSTVGVIGVDPSSRSSGGAVLGDRTRMVTDPRDDGVYIRSMAARDRLGGLASLSVAAMVLMRTVHDLVVVETVGVGQSECDVGNVADTVVLCVQPESGDSLQYMKAGIVEIPHIAVVTKCDVGPAARRAAADVARAIGLAKAAGQGWSVRVASVSATCGEGIDALIGDIGDHARWLAETDNLRPARHAQAEAWLRDAVRQRFGLHGLERVSRSLRLEADPFATLHRLASELSGGL